MIKQGLMVCLLASSSASAGNAVTVENRFACLREEWLDDVYKFMAANDKDSGRAYINQKKCIIMKGGVEVTITDYAGLLGTKTGFVLQGVKLWASKDSIKLK